MKTLIKHFDRVFCLAVFPAALLASLSCYGHEVPVHQAITQSAFGASTGLQLFLTENLGSANCPLTASPSAIGAGAEAPPAVWLQLGSYFEDMEDQRRCLDHFYTVKPQRTPGQVIGLTDWSEPIIGGFIASLFCSSTVNSFVWGTVNGISEPSYNLGFNVYKWSDARTYELAALTNATPDARNTSMATMLYTLGHVLHLNQDLSSPDHVRDAAHLLTAYFEKYGEANYTNNPQWFVPPPHDQQGWVYWQSQGFTNLLNFWDRNLYKNGSSLALNQETNGSVKLGLAEFSNGNFLGETALYRECYDSGDIHYFPFPSFNSTTYSTKIPQLLVTGLRTVFLPNGDLVHRIYLDKNGDGISFNNHSVLSYLGVAYALRSPAARLSTSPLIQRVSVSINDNNVLQAYHDRLIPKAVEYSAGILDYFFRGTMDVSASLDANTNYTFGVTNTSSQDFGPGSFFLLEEDTNSIRTIVQTNALNRTLPSGSGMDITFPGPVPQGTKFLVVYQGTVGVANGTTNALIRRMRIFASSPPGRGSNKPRHMIIWCGCVMSALPPAGQLIRFWKATIFHSRLLLAITK